MQARLPASVADYFEGRNARDFDRAVSGFAEEAVVGDEARDHRGRAAVRSWIASTALAYRDRAEVLAVTTEEGGVTVRAQVSGTFPGSPIVLRFAFTLDAGQITALRIGV